MKKPHLLRCARPLRSDIREVRLHSSFIARSHLDLFDRPVLAFVKAISKSEMREAPAAALGCRADLTDTGKRKAHRADNDGRK
jgi:hypothetical protein